MAGPVEFGPNNPVLQKVSALAWAVMWKGSSRKILVFCHPFVLLRNPRWRLNPD